MTASVLLVCLLLGGARALVDLNCSDNVTCIEGMGRDLVKSLRERKAVRLFELLTIEPLPRRQGRSSRGLWGLMENHAMSFDWSDFTFRFTLPKDGRDDALDLEMFENRSVKDESDPSPKKSSSKVEEESEEDKTPKMGIKRRQKKKVMQALIPLLFGMKSAGAVIFAFAIVTALTMKAFIASKLALVVTIGMALKKLYETYSTGVGFQNHPYLYSQYPIDFPSASSHAYSVSGVSPQFASNEMYSPNMLDSHAHEFLQQQDASAQQSQQVPLLLNSTNASERWDGKSKLQKFLEPFIEGFKNVINPIANIFYGAIPTFRGLNTEVSTDKSVEVDTVDAVEEIKKPKEFLVPQPRFIAQRKNFVKPRNRPKKYTELKIDLNRLKHSKDFQDYIKTKKYKYNYPNTYYYPRVKYVLYNPHMFYFKPNNSRLVPFRKPAMPTSTPAAMTTLSVEASEWKPLVVLNETGSKNVTNASFHVYPLIRSTRDNKKVVRFFRNQPSLERRKRIKRNISFTNSSRQSSVSNKRSIFTVLDFISDLVTEKPVSKIVYLDNDDNTKSNIKNKIVIPKEKPPLYYSIMYNALMITFDIMEGLTDVLVDLERYYVNNYNSNPVKKEKPIKRNNKPYKNLQKIQSNVSELNYNNKINKTKPITRKTVINKQNLITENLILNETLNAESATEYEIEKKYNNNKFLELTNKKLNIDTLVDAHKTDLINEKLATKDTMISENITEKINNPVVDA